MIPLERLQEIADKATPGPWWMEGDDAPCVYAHTPGARPNGEGLLEVRYYSSGIRPNAVADARHITAFNPQAAKALLAEMAELRTLLEWFAVPSFEAHTTSADEDGHCDVCDDPWPCEVERARLILGKES